MSTDAARVLALGAEVELGGESHQVVFGLAALAQIELEFENYDRWARAISSTPASGPIFRAIKVGLEAGLLHAMTPPEARRWVAAAVPKEGPAYREALLAAAAEALPPAKVKAPKDQAAGGSRGRTSTGSGPSSSAAAMLSSAG